MRLNSVKKKMGHNLQEYGLFVEKFRVSLLQTFSPVCMELRHSTQPLLKYGAKTFFSNTCHAEGSAASGNVL